MPVLKYRGKTVRLPYTKRGYAKARKLMRMGARKLARRKKRY